LPVPGQSFDLRTGPRFGGNAFAYSKSNIITHSDSNGNVENNSTGNLDNNSEGNVDNSNPNVDNSDSNESIVSSFEGKWHLVFSGRDVRAKFSKPVRVQARFFTSGNGKFGKKNCNIIYMKY
jgi:phage-related protein